MKEAFAAAAMSADSTREVVTEVILRFTRFSLKNVLLVT
jgi:hypothetical protein